VDRRDFLKISAGLAAGAGADAPATTWKPERGAKLRVLRWKAFVQGDEDAWLKNTAEFARRTGVAVQIESQSWEEVRPRAAVAAGAGAGPDVVLSTFDDASFYPEKLVDVTDLAEYLGRKYGGWYGVCRQYLQPGGRRWIGVPLGAAGSAFVYRVSRIKEAGFDSFPRDTAGFLALCQALKARNHPVGFALGDATGDANTWTHWLVWSFGGKLVDGKNKVVINSPQTLQALEYARELYQTFAPGTLSWLDPSNNEAFLDDRISVTGNGISIYHAAKTSQDPRLKAMAADIGHARPPIGPVGRPTELHLFLSQMIFKYTQYPNAAKEYLRFMMEREQYEPWQQASIGYVTHPLTAYESNPIWTADPKHAPYRDCMKIMLPNCYSGKPAYASAQCMADFVIVNMVAEAASGQRTPKQAAERAQRRAERYYRVRPGS
jgi:multiple sugar transport system substrate-binding protein